MTAPSPGPAAGGPRPGHGDDSTTLAPARPRGPEARARGARGRRRPATGGLVWLAVALLSAGCALGSLPLRETPPCPAIPVTALWTCVLAGGPGPEAESAVRSTVRAGGLARKAVDQDEATACSGHPPPGFARLDVPPVAPARPPLHALWAEPAPGRPVVLVVHGLYDSKLTPAVTVVADLLRRAGFGVLVPDMRWHGCLLSPGWLPTLGLEEGPDLVAWARWLHAFRPGHPVGVVGLSLGGLAALHAAGHPDAVDVLEAGVVVISPAAGLVDTAAQLDPPSYAADRGLGVVVLGAFRDYLAHRMWRLGLAPANGRPFATFLDWLAGHGPFPGGTTSATLLEAADPAPRLRAARRPVLVVASRNDPLIAPVGAAQLAEAARDRPHLRVVVTPHGGHIGQIGLYPDWVAGVLVRFFGASPEVPPAP